MNREREAPRAEFQERVMRGWRATEVPVPGHFDHKTIFKQKFVKLTTLYPGAIGLASQVDESHVIPAGTDTNAFAAG